MIENVEEINIEIINVFISVVFYICKFLSNLSAKGDVELLTSCFILDYVIGNNFVELQRNMSFITKYAFKFLPKLPKTIIVA